MVKRLWNKWIIRSHRKWRILKFPCNLFKFFKELRFFLHYGFPYEAMYNHYEYFIKTTKEILNQYLESHLGYPGFDEGDTNESWEDTLHHMIELLDQMEETYDYSTPYKLDGEEERMNKAKDEFFSLYSKWFYCLWD